MIKLEDCKHGFLYKIDARNFSYGIFNKDDSGFIGVRHKFSAVYLFTEFHWDTGAPFGTVTPLVELEECSIRPLQEHNDELFTWLKARIVELNNAEA